MIEKRVMPGINRGIGASFRRAYALHADPAARQMTTERPSPNTQAPGDPLDGNRGVFEESSILRQILLGQRRLVSPSHQLVAVNRATLSAVAALLGVSASASAFWGGGYGGGPWGAVATALPTTAVAILTPLRLRPRASKGILPI